MRRLTVLTLTVGLTVAACGGSGTDDTSTTEVESESSTTAPSEVTTTTAAPAETTTTVAAETTTTGGATGAGGNDCLVGAWVLDSEAFVENFGAIFAAEGMGDADVTALDGTFTVEMNSDGTYDAVRDAWGFAVATADGTVIIEINGTESGTWSTSGDTLTIDGDIADLVVNSSIEVDGQVVPLPAGQTPVDTPPGLATDSTFTCAADTLTLTNGGVDSVLNRS